MTSEIAKDPYWEARGAYRAQTEIVYTWPDGREEIRYSRPKGSAMAAELIRQVDQLRERIGDQCPYSYRHTDDVCAKEKISQQQPSAAGV